MPRTVNLFGQDFLLKTIGCNIGHTIGRPIPPVVSLYVKATNTCNAHCLFCSNEEFRADASAFDTAKFFRVVDAILAQKDLHFGSIRFTGGEPSVVTEQVMFQLLERLSGNDYKQLFLHLNTNACHPNAIRLMQHPRWNSISVSIHHYDRRCLSEIYGTETLQDFSFHPLRRDGLKMNISCNLIRGFIDSAPEAQKMMDYALDIGADTLGFVSLMQLNDYCRRHYVDYAEIQWDTIPSLYLSHTMNRGHICRCADYLYNSNGHALQVYMRNNLDPGYCESSLIFDGRHLRQGFYGER